LLLVAKSLGVSVSIAGIALAMAMGGWFHSRRVAETMSHKIVRLEPRSAFLGNLCTSALVIAASKYGLPLSTTHVSVGAISGLSMGGEKISRATLKQILLSWIATLPCAATLGAIANALLNNLLR
jgi:inorganic phosphate transporter, PiT family